jgi:hypothetical protein
MAQIVRLEDDSQKHRNDAKSVPPGPKLAALIDSAICRDRPGCWIGRLPGSDRRLGVPNVRAVRFTESGRHKLSPPVESLLAVLPHRLVLVLESWDPVAFQQLRPQDHSAGRRLYAAALRDILGLPKEEVAKQCGYGGEDLGMRKAREAISRGRKLWSRVGAWPWWYFEPAGQPPRNWHAHGGNVILDAALLTWETGRMRPPVAIERARADRRAA